MRTLHCRRFLRLCLILYAAIAPRRSLALGRARAHPGRVDGHGECADSIERVVLVLPLPLYLSCHFPHGKWPFPSGAGRPARSAGSRVHPWRRGSSWSRPWRCCALPPPQCLDAAHLSMITWRVCYSVGVVRVLLWHGEYTVILLRSNPLQVKRTDIHKTNSGERSDGTRVAPGRRACATTHQTKRPPRPRGAAGGNQKKNPGTSRKRRAPVDL